jgi:hypothetical protein
MSISRLLLNAMKIKPQTILLSLVLLIVSAALLSGCTTTMVVKQNADGTITTNTIKKADIARVARIAGDAARIGAAIYMQEHPEARAQFALAYSILDSLIRDENYDPLKFREALAGLPFDRFKGSAGELYITLAVIVWDELAHEFIAVNEKAWAKPVMVSVRDGLGRALR